MQVSGGGRNTVDEVFDLSGAAAVDSKIRLAGSGDVGSQKYKCQRVTIVLRKILDAFVVDHQTSLSIFRSDQRRLSSDGYSLRRASHFQGDIQSKAVTHAQRDPIPIDGAESGRSYRHVVLARDQSCETETSLGIGFGVDAHVGGDVPDTHGGIDNDGAA